MAYPELRPLPDKYLTVRIADVSTAETVYVAVPAQAEVVKVYSALGAAITTADAVLTVSKNGTAMTGGTITIAAASSAGAIDSCEPSAGHQVDAGDYISVATDGGSTGAAPAIITIVLREL